MTGCRRIAGLPAAAALVLALGSAVLAQDAPLPSEGAQVSAALGLPGGGQGLADVVKILLFLSVLSLLPAIVLTMTSFTRLVIVLSFVRRAIGLQQMPPNAVIIGLSLFLTAFLMAPIWKRVHAEAIQPALKREIQEAEALQRAIVPLRTFMLRHTRQKDLALFLSVANLPKPNTPDDVPTYIVVPAFAIGEIKTAFLMGFVVFLPMLVIDLVMATLLTSMGMFMLPPIMVSTPLKILLFVLVDGWHLVVGSLVKSFQVFA